MSDVTTRPVALAIVARVPYAGSCKTRLCPPLDPAGAAELSAGFICDTMAKLRSVASGVPAEPIALYTGAAEGSRDLDVFGGATCVVQRGESFGERLSNGASDILARGYAGVALIDSDSPTLPTSSLERTVLELMAPGDRIVIGPALDGGYYLLGMKVAYPELFEGIAWSTPAVYEQTVERARRLGLRIVTLPPWYDVDDASGLDRLRCEFASSFPPGGYDAPRTRERLAALTANA